MQTLTADLTEIKPKSATALQVAFITSTFPFGNAEEFLHAELEALSNLGCELVLIPAVPRSTTNLHADLNASVARFPLLAPKTLYRALFGFRRNVGGALRALRIILQSKIAFRPKLKNLVLYPTGLAVADEVVARRIDHIHAYWLSGASTVALIASQVARVPWSYTAHSGDIFLEDNLIAEKTHFAYFGRVISETAQRGIVRQSDSSSSSKLRVIHLGVMIPDQKLLRNNGQRSDLRILCPAYFYNFKDHTSLLSALRQVADSGLHFQCIFAGEGPLRSQVANNIKKLKLEEMVSMVGVIPHDQLMRQMESGSYDIVVLSSIDLEGIPVSLMESMAAGIPCVATKTGAVGELIDQSCGILVNERDPSALAEAILSLARDPERRKQLGENARQRVYKEFNVVNSATSLLTLISGAQAGRDRLT